MQNKNEKSLINAQDGFLGRAYGGCPLCYKLYKCVWHQVKALSYIDPYEF